jgi:hypothetical protein
VGAFETSQVSSFLKMKKKQHNVMSFHFYEQGTKIAYSFEISHRHEQIIRITQMHFDSMKAL